MRIFSLVVFLMLASVYGVAQPPGYTYGKEIVIQASQVSGTSDLTDFPVLISLVDTDLRTTGNGGGVQSANGYDIIFMSDCFNQLDHQIERYVAGTGEYVAWVKVPVLSATSDTPIYIYYGNASAVNTSTTNVWDVNYVGVWHLSNGDFTDASGTGNNGTNTGTTNFTNAKIAGARAFTASGERIQIPTTGWSGTSGTISLWGYVNAFSANHQYFFGHTTQPPFQNRIQIYTNDTGGNLDVGLGSDHNEALGVATLATGTWYYMVLTWNSGNYSVYVNNNAPVTGTYAGLSTIHTVAEIGNQSNPPDNEAQNGRIDEVRVSNTARSLDWIRTEFNNQNNPSAFYTVSSQLTAAATCALPVEFILFEAIPDDEKVKLIWTTASETNNDFFSIERSTDAKTWEELEQVQGAGTTKERQRYITWDARPYPGVSYYRIKQTDFDGAFEYSWIRRVDIQSKGIVNIYPNPASREFIIELDDARLAMIHLVNSLGQPVAISPEVVDRKSLVIATDHLNKGVYYLTVIQAGKATRHIMIVE